MYAHDGADVEEADCLQRIEVIPCNADGQMPQCPSRVASASHATTAN